MAASGIGEFAAEGQLAHLHMVTTTNQGETVTRWPHHLLYSDVISPIWVTFFNEFLFLLHCSNKGWVVNHGDQSGSFLTFQVYLSLSTNKHCDYTWYSAIIKMQCGLWWASLKLDYIWHYYSLCTSTISPLCIRNKQLIKQHI